MKVIWQVKVCLFKNAYSENLRHTDIKYGTVIRITHPFLTQEYCHQETQFLISCEVASSSNLDAMGLSKQ